MNSRQLLRRISDGHVQNIRFTDLQRLAEDLGFRLVRVRGSHHMYKHERAGTWLNLQEERGNAKAYQVRALQRRVERYDLHLEDE